MTANSEDYTDPLPGETGREFPERRIREFRANGDDAMAAVFEEKMEAILAGPQLSHDGPTH